MAMKIKGDWCEDGFLLNLPAAKCYVLIAEDNAGLYDAETGDRITIDDDGELRGWPCQTFLPDRNDLERLRGLNAPS